MDRRELHEELESCHARGEAEDRYNERRKDVREIEEGMRTVVRPVSRHEEMLNTALDMDEHLHFDILNDEEFNY